MLLKVTPFLFPVGVAEGDGEAVVTVEAIDRQAVLIAGTGRMNRSLPLLGLRAVDFDGTVKLPGVSCRKKYPIYGL